MDVHLRRWPLHLLNMEVWYVFFFSFTKIENSHPIGDFSSLFPLNLIEIQLQFNLKSSLVEERSMLFENS